MWITELRNLEPFYGGMVTFFATFFEKKGHKKARKHRRLQAVSGPTRA